MRYLVDSDWIIDALTGVSSTIDTLDQLSSDGLAVSIITVGELYEGAFYSSSSEEKLRTTRQFLAGYVVLGLTDAIMGSFAQHRALLRRQGLLIPDFDLLIAATALTFNLTLLTRNQRHFGRIPNLELYRAG